MKKRTERFKFQPSRALFKLPTNRSNPVNLLTYYAGQTLRKAYRTSFVTSGRVTNPMLTHLWVRRTQVSQTWISQTMVRDERPCRSRLGSTCADNCGGVQSPAFVF